MTIISECLYVLISSAQLVRTMHHICKVRDSNPGHHKKKVNVYISIESLVLLLAHTYYFA